MIIINVNLNFLQNILLKDISSNSHILILYYVMILVLVSASYLEKSTVIWLKYIYRSVVISFNKVEKFYPKILSPEYYILIHILKHYL